jgi:hypothetical protein
MMMSRMTRSAVRMERKEEKRSWNSDKQDKEFAPNHSANVCQSQESLKNLDSCMSELQEMNI